MMFLWFVPKMPSFDIFCHNPKRPSADENVGRNFDSGAAHDFRGGLHGPDSDQRSAHAKGELNAPFAAFLGDGRHAFGGSVSQTHKLASCRVGVLGRIADFRRDDFSPRANAYGERIACPQYGFPSAAFDRLSGRCRLALTITALSNRPLSDRQTPRSGAC